LRIFLFPYIKKQQLRMMVLLEKFVKLVFDQITYFI